MMTFVGLFAWAEDFSVTVVVASCEISRPSILYTEPSCPRGCKASCIHPVALSLTCPAVQSYFYQSETAPARVTSTEPFASFGFPRGDNLVKVNKALKVHLLVLSRLLLVCKKSVPSRILQENGLYSVWYICIGKLQDVTFQLAALPSLVLLFFLFRDKWDRLGGLDFKRITTFLDKIYAQLVSSWLTY